MRMCGRLALPLHIGHKLFPGGVKMNFSSPLYTRLLPPSTPSFDQLKLLRPAYIDHQEWNGTHDVPKNAFSHNVQIWKKFASSRLDRVPLIAQLQPHRRLRFPYKRPNHSHSTFTQRKLELHPYRISPLLPMIQQIKPILVALAQLNETYFQPLSMTRLIRHCNRFDTMSVQIGLCLKLTT